MIQRWWHLLFGHDYGDWLPCDVGHARICRCSETQIVATHVETGILVPHA